VSATGSPALRQRRAICSSAVFEPYRALAAGCEEDPSGGAVAEVVVEGTDDGRGERDAGGLHPCVLPSAPVAVVVTVVADLGVNPSEIRSPQQLSSEAASRPCDTPIHRS
jgi:hypothetical protein